MTQNETVPKALYDELLANVSASLDEPSVKGHPKVQPYLDLDAAGFLLVALGHLVKAKEKLEEERLSRSVYRAKRDTIMAANFARYALAELEQLKEEPCE